MSDSLISMMSNLPDSKGDEPRNLTDDDVKAAMQRLSKANVNVLNDVYRKYSNAVTSILTTAIKQTKDDSEIIELERLRRLTTLAPLEEMFIRSKDKIWSVREHIVKKNADYFIKKDYSKMIKKDHNQAFLENIIEIVRSKFLDLSPEEQEFYWIKANTLLKCVIIFEQEMNK
jgi:hypothetical protein